MSGDSSTRIFKVHYAQGPFVDSSSESNAHDVDSAVQYF